MIFEVYRKRDTNYSYIDGNVNLFPCDVLADPKFKAWRKSVALTKNKFETNNYIITMKVEEITNDKKTI